MYADRVGISVSDAVRKDLPLKVRFIGCPPLEISSASVWKIVLHSSVISYVCMLGMALAAAGTVIALQDPTASKIHLPLLLFAKPLLVVLIATSIGVIYIEFTKRYPRYAIFYDGEKLSVHWIIPIAISLYIVNSGNILVRDLVENTEHSVLRYTLAPILYALIAEAFSVFAVTHLPAIRGFFDRSSSTNAYPVLPEQPVWLEAQSVNLPPFEAHADIWRAEVTDLGSNGREPFDVPPRPCKLARIGTRSVDLAGPVVLSARGNYVEVADPKGSELVRGPLASLLEEIDPDTGIQVHRSSWISFGACERVEKQGTDLFLVTSLGMKAKIARPRHREVCEVLDRRRLLAG